MEAIKLKVESIYLKEKCCIIFVTHLRIVDRVTELCTRLDIASCQYSYQKQVHPFFNIPFSLLFTIKSNITSISGICFVLQDRNDFHKTIP